MKRSVERKVKTVGSIKPILENKVIADVMDYLNKRGDVIVWRQQSRPTFDFKSKRFRRMPKYALKGVPDILGFTMYGAKFIGLECKTPQRAGKLRPEQKRFLEAAKQSGAIVGVVTCVYDAQRIMTEAME